MRHALAVGLGLLIMTTGCGKGSGVAPAPVEKMPTAIQLFNGRDLTGWTCDLSDAGVKMEDVWSVADGVLQCKGKPGGVLRTLEEYSDYVLSLEWRWPPGTGGGNNGVLVHSSTPRTLGIWPKSIEVQLAKDNAGDFWIIGTELDVENEQARKQDRRHLNLTDGSEKPLGEWNRMEITCKGNEVIVLVNGVLVNHATNCNVTRGAICLQSEGAPIEYRNVILTPLPAK
ncbi:MAG: DUF1080 domain-containing protein [Planctomycetes bacterium]|nr:DUF1080 domain-containing protein [Planctomycetota bacterium]